MSAGQGVYIQAIADGIRSEIDDADLPDVPSDGLFHLYALLALAVGPSVSAADVHDAWSAWMLTVDPTHPSLVPFEELDDSIAVSDAPFVRAIRDVAERLSLPNGDRADRLTGELPPDRR